MRPERAMGGLRLHLARCCRPVVRAALARCSTAARAVATLLLAAGLVGPAAAHRSGESRLQLTQQGAAFDGLWEIGLHDLAPLHPEAAALPDADAGQRWVAAQPGLPARLLGRLDLRGDGAPCPVAAAGDWAVEPRPAGPVLLLRLQARCAAAPQQLQLDYRLLQDLDPRHQGLLRLRAGTLDRPAVFTTVSPQQRFLLRAPSAWERLAADLRSGAAHIWSGYDHLLFLLCLLLPALRQRNDLGRPAHDAAELPAPRAVLVEVAKVVTAFTVAHSVTLSLAALHWVSLPARLSESAIAASVLLAAAMNLRPAPRLRRWQAAFGFGLVHGFGFASAVDELGVSGAGQLPTLLGFNLGVELGQLAVVAALLPLGLALRGRPWWPQAVVRRGSQAIALLALLWLVERAFDLPLWRLS